VGPAAPAAITLNSSSSSDPTCEHGVLASDKGVCCAKSCGRCGGTSCQSLPGGRDNCCSSEIKKAAHHCSGHDPPCLMPLPPPTPPPGPTPAATRINPKRGFVADGAKSCNTPLLLNTSGWHYDYNQDRPYGKPGQSGNCMLANSSGFRNRFTGMNWCLSSVEKPVPTDVNQTYWMGFNEPNNLHNCHTSAAAVAKAWGRVMELHPPPTQLVSPATAGNGIPWYDDL
jgi:hypothetical protein